MKKSPLAAVLLIVGTTFPHADNYIPLENFDSLPVGESPAVEDARHLLTFLQEKKKTAKHGYVICRCPRPLQLHDQITALPWFCL